MTATSVQESLRWFTPQVHALWDDSQATSLHIITGGGAYNRIGFRWDTCVSGSGTAAVIDGCKLLMTPLRRGLVPPPMCAVAAVAAAPINDVTICDMRGFEEVAALQSDGRLAVARSMCMDLWEKTLQVGLALI